MYNLKFDLALLGEENVVYKDVNIDFNYGDIINIIGETGCGKSTFYKMLMGRVKHASGIISSTITNNTVVVSDYVSVPKEVLIKDIFCFIGIGKISYVKRIFPEIYNYISEIKDKEVGNLSTGERRILEIFCALSTKKNILILDEASNGLDSKNRNVLTDKLRLLAKQNDIVIFNTTHYIEDALALGGKIYIMNKEKALFKKYTGNYNVNDISNYINGGVV